MLTTHSTGQRGVAVANVPITGIAAFIAWLIFATDYIRGMETTSDLCCTKRQWNTSLKNETVLLRP